MKENNYPNWLVRLNVAEKLKEIGLRVRTADYYVVDGNRCSFRTDFDVDFDKLQRNNYNAYPNYVAIPNFTQVLAWFRGKKLFATIDWVGVNEYVYNIKSTMYGFEFIESKSLPTYELCRDALVDKLIEVYKEKISK